MLDIKISTQAYTFLCAFICGCFLGVLYIALKCLRKTFADGKIVTVISDLLFMLIFTFVTCLFSIGFTEGFVRYYVVVAEIAGVIAFRFTLGFVFYKLFLIVFKICGRIKAFFQKNIPVFIKKLLKARHKMLYNKVNKKAKSAN